MTPWPFVLLQFLSIAASGAVIIYGATFHVTLLVVLGGVSFVYSLYERRR